MSLSFSLGIEKMKSADVGRAHGHNCRLHPTASQLRPDAWFSADGRHQAEPWHQDRIDRAKALAKRKDAVIGIQFIVQLGNQTDWRHEPAPDFPEGRPIDYGEACKRVNAILKGVREWVGKEFGDTNVASIELHTDESTPHFHVVVTPVTTDGKLQAKAWLDGPSRTAALRKRAWEAVNRHIACEYTPGAPGGAPHDPSLAAGQAPVPPEPTLLDRMSGHARVRALEQANAELKAEVATLTQALFSRKKGHYSRGAIEAAEALKGENDELRAENAALKSAGIAAMSQIDALRHQLQDDRAAHARALAEQERVWQEKIGPLERTVEEVTTKNGALADENNRLFDELREHRQDQRHSM